MQAFASIIELGASTVTHFFLCIELTWHTLTPLYKRLTLLALLATNKLLATGEAAHFSARCRMQTCMSPPGTSRSAALPQRTAAPNAARLGVTQNGLASPSGRGARCKLQFEMISIDENATWVTRSARA